MPPAAAGSLSCAANAASASGPFVLLPVVSMFMTGGTVTNKVVGYLWESFLLRLITVLIRTFVILTHAI
jgi:hypothetical protein